MRVPMSLNACDQGNQRDVGGAKGGARVKAWALGLPIEGHLWAVFLFLLSQKVEIYKRIPNGLSIPTSRAAIPVGSAQTAHGYPRLVSRR